MAVSGRPRPFMRRLPYTELALGALIAVGALAAVGAARSAEPIAAVAAGFAVRYGNVISPDRVRALTVLPGETVTFEVVVDREPGSDYVARPAAGRLAPLDAGRWVWTDTEV